jgi:hypothetical protein
VTFDAILAELDREIDAASPEVLSGLVVQLAARVAGLGARLSGGGSRRWVSVEDAAAAAGVGADDVVRWARNPSCGWWTRGTRKAPMRVDAGAFDRWLAAQRFTQIRQRERRKPAIRTGTASDSSTVTKIHGRNRP